IAIFPTGPITCAFARSMPQLIAARAIQGFGAAGLIPIALTVSGDIYTLEQRARIQGLFSGVWGFAALVGPLIGAFLTVHFGWRSIFSINIPLGTIAFFLVATRLKESRARLADPVDIAGAATLAIGVILILFAVLHSPAGRAGFSLLLRTALMLAGPCSPPVLASLVARPPDSPVPPVPPRPSAAAS